MTSLRIVAEAMPWGSLLTAGGLLLAAWLLWQQSQTRRQRETWERDRRCELEAYCLLEITLPTGTTSRKLTERAKRVCRLVTEKSVFTKAALFLLSADGRLSCMGSCGMDDLSLDALARWSDRIQREENTGTAASSEQKDAECRKSFPVALRGRAEFDAMSAQGCSTATMVPVRMHRGRLVGLVAVCSPSETLKSTEHIQDAVTPLELLAAKLARTIERAHLMERLIEVERLAGAGHLVAGVAEELSKPLNMVLDCSELIAGTTSEARVRQHAETIAAEAQAMSEVLGTLRELWKPRQDVGQPVQDS